MYVNYSSIANLPFVEKGSAPSTRESPEIHKEIQRLQVKKIIRERLIRVARCYPCFIFLTCGHRRRLMDTICSHTGIIFPPLTSCPRPSAWTNQRKNTDITDFARIGLHGFFSLILFLPMIFRSCFGFYRIWSTRCSLLPDDICQ